MAATTITQLLEAGVHFGHQTRRWNPKMKPYIYGTRNGITIFDLTITMRQLAEACSFLRDTIASGHNVLFVGAKRQAQEVVREAAERTGMYYMCDRWLGGLLTNNGVILRRVGYMKQLQRMEADGTTASMPKKEVARLRRELGKLERMLGGIAEMKVLPHALIVMDVGRETIAVREANKLGIPVVGLVDSNCNPDMVDYVVPGNDDALRSIKVIVDAIANAIADGVHMRTKGSGPSTPAAPPPSPAPEAEAADAAAPEGAAEVEAPPEGAAAEPGEDTPAAELGEDTPAADSGEEPAKASADA